jgi:hypothetical protein
MTKVKDRRTINESEIVATIPSVPAATGKEGALLDQTGDLFVKQHEKT